MCAKCQIESQNMLINSEIIQMRYFKIFKFKFNNLENGKQFLNAVDCKYA